VRVNRCTVCSSIDLRLGHLTRVYGVPFVAVITFMCHGPNGEGEHNAEHKQFGGDVDRNPDIGSMPMRQLCGSPRLTHAQHARGSPTWGD
jgi:hypothetical protein